MFVLVFIYSFQCPCPVLPVLFFTTCVGRCVGTQVVGFLCTCQVICFVYQRTKPASFTQVMSVKETLALFLVPLSVFEHSWNIYWTLMLPFVHRELKTRGKHNSEDFFQLQYKQVEQ